MGRPLIPLNTTKPYGRLTILEEIEAGKNGRRVKCRCECGAIVQASFKLLRTGNTTSCGCLRRDLVAAKNTKHGGGKREGRRPEYNIWKAMRQRCTNPNIDRWESYGGRGITFDPAWNDFSVFLADVGPRPSPRHSLDRIDNDGNYEKSNVKWSTLNQQARNKRDALRLVYQGRPTTVADLAEQHGVPYDRLAGRLRKGWTIELALSTPCPPPAPPLEFNGQSLTVAEWARRVGVPESALRGRLDKGWTVEQALTTPLAFRTPRKKADACAD